MKKHFQFTFLLAAISIMVVSCVIPIDCACNKFFAVPNIAVPNIKEDLPTPVLKKSLPQLIAIETSDKLISHFLILNNKIVMESRTQSSAVLFDGNSVLGFFTQEKESSCAVHAIKIYDFDQDGRPDLLELDGKLFQWSVADKTKLYLPEFGYSKKDAFDLMKYAGEIFNQYKFIFKNGGGIQQKEGIFIKEIHDLYVEKYWEFYAKGCDIKIPQPTLNDLALFDPKK